MINNEEIDPVTLEELNQKVDLDFQNADLDTLQSFIHYRGALSNCIVSKADDAYVDPSNSSTIIVPKGMKVLIPNGRNSDGTKNNIIYELTSNASRVVTWSAPTGQCMFINTNNVIDSTSFIREYYISDVQPSFTNTGNHLVWYNYKENKMYRSSDAGVTWTQVFLAYIGKLYSNESFEVTKLITNETTSLLTENLYNIPYESIQKIIGWSIPDYSSYIEYTAGVEFIAPAKGIILYIGRLTDNHTRSLTINGNVIFSTATSGSYLNGWQQGTPWTVNKGDKVLASNVTGLRFFAFKGTKNI